MSGSAPSNFVTEHKIALAVTAVVGVGSIAALVYHLRQQSLQGGDSNHKANKHSSKSKRRKSRKNKKKSLSKPPYPVAKNGDPLVTEESVKKLSKDESIKWGGALKERGNDLFKKGEYQSAIDYYTKALICKEDAVYYSNRSACYSALGDNKNTIADTTKALEINPSYRKCLLRRARAYENSEKYPEAMFDLTALAIYGGMNDSSNETMLERVLKKHSAKINKEKYSNLPKVLPSTSSLCSFFNAFAPENIDMDESHYQDATPKKYLVQALNKLKLETTDGYKEADVLINQAVASLDKSTEGTDDKTAAMIYEYAGSFDFLKTKSEDAMKLLQKSLDLYPRPKTYVLIALIKADKGDYVGADTNFGKAIKLNPEDPDIYYHYGQIFYLVGDLTKAKTNFEKAKKLNPNNVYSFIQLACLAYRQGNTAQCDALFKEAKEKFPTSPEVPNYYGEILFDKQDFDGALKQFQISAKLQAAQNTFKIGALPLINESAIYQRNGDMTKCVEILQKACEVDPKSEVARMNLGQVYLAQQKVPEAIKLFEDACVLSRSPDDRSQAISLMEASKMQLKIKKDPVLSKKVQELIGQIPQNPAMA